MNRSANVRSLESIRTMASALENFGAEATAALDLLDVEIRRAQEWIEHDRRHFWETQSRRGEEHLNEARVNLQRARTIRRMDHHQPACREEQIAVERARRQLEMARRKIEVVKRWNYALERQSTEVQGKVNQLADWVQATLPRALAALARMSDHLEAYTAASRVPAPSSAPVSVPPNEEEPEHDDLRSEQPDSEADGSDEDASGSPRRGGRPMG